MSMVRFLVRDGLLLVLTLEIVIETIFDSHVLAHIRKDQKASAGGRAGREEGERAEGGPNPKSLNDLGWPCHRLVCIALTLYRCRMNANPRAARLLLVTSPYSVPAMRH